MIRIIRIFCFMHHFLKTVSGPHMKPLFPSIRVAIPPCVSLSRPSAGLSGSAAPPPQPAAPSHGSAAEAEPCGFWLGPPAHSDDPKHLRADKDAPELPHIPK